MWLRYLIIILAINFYSVAPCSGQQVIGNVYFDGDRSDNKHIVVVEKDSSTLYLVSIEETLPVVVRSFSVLLGKKNGDKLREGDGRTPEGIYFITDFIPPEKLNPLLYGIGAFPLNYPNIVDRLYHKTGHGIWIHGRGTLQRKSTNGCVSLEDKDFRAFMQFAGVGTPVIITNSLIWLPMDEYKRHKGKLMTNLLSFLKTWEAGDLNRFKEFFSARYLNAQGEDLSRMLKRRQKVFSRESTRYINASDFMILQENSRELMYQYQQLYCSDRVIGYGTKRLYLENTPHGYKIVAEEFFRRDPRMALRKKLEGFVRAWKTAWQSEDIQRYMAFYHKDFRSSRGGLNGWKKYKEEIFSRDRIISIGIDDLRVKILRPALYRVTFTQEYMSEHHYDLGKKTLMITGCPSEFKIIRETWKRLD